MSKNETLEEKMMERQRIETQIACLQQHLSAPTSDVGDWKIIKIYEARLQNQPDPYNYEELSQARQAVREQINQLQTQLEQMND